MIGQGDPPQDWDALLYFFLTGVATVAVDWLRRRVMRGEDQRERHAGDGE